jgi:hypothetical protein
MGANAVTTVPVYTAGEVLTAADMNITNSGIPVFATTVTRDAAFGGTGEKTLAEGQFAYIEATDTTQYYDGAAWQPVGVAPGLVLVKTQTIGSGVASVTVSDAFSATYDNYKISISGGVGSAVSQIYTTLGASATGYTGSMIYYTNTGSPTSSGTPGALSSYTTSFSWSGSANTNSIIYNVELQNPFLAKYTFIAGPWNDVAQSGSMFGAHASAVSYSAFTLTPSTGTLTGGTIRVYGYANS